jgi:carbamoyl-phosphate synthase large subunit
MPGRESAIKVYEKRQELGIVPVYKRVDTCAAEFESFTPYMYSTFEDEDEAQPTARKKVIILGSGRTASGRELSSTTAAAMRPLRCTTMALRPSW